MLVLKGIWDIWMRNLTKQIVRINKYIFSCLICIKSSLGHEIDTNIYKNVEIMYLNLLIRLH